MAIAALICVAGCGGNDGSGFTGAEKKAYDDARDTCADAGVERVLKRLDYHPREPDPGKVASAYGTKLWPPEFKQAAAEGCLAGFGG